MERYFEFEKYGTNYRREFLAGLTTFLAMAYILFVNADLLSSAGMDRDAVFVATGLAAAIGSAVMGIWAKYPIAQAPGMGLNAFFAYTVVLGMGIPWQAALSGVLVSGIIFFILAVTRVREKIINAIPLQLKLATGAGIGLFIAFIGLQGAGIIVEDPAGAVIVALGDIHAPMTLLTIFGIVVTGFFMVRGFRGGIFYGMVVTAIAGIIVGLIDAPGDLVSPIPGIGETFGQAITYPLQNPTEFFTVQILVVIFTFLFVDFFDTAGTLMAVANQGGFLKDNKLPRANRALGSDSIATMTGAVLGTSTTTAYVESSAGIGVGGRTGFTSVVVAALFLLALFFSPLLGVVNEYVTAPALIIVGVLMAASLASIEWKKLEYAIPSFVTVVAIPLTYSIATGIALGFILYPLMKMFKGEFRQVHPFMYIMFVVFVAYFIWLVE